MELVVPDTIVYVPLMQKNMAHREQVEMVVSLDDVCEIDPELAQAIQQNTRRYTMIFSEAISEMLPQYKTKEVMAKDVLDVYIEHRLLLQQRLRGEGTSRDPRHSYPPELLRRL